MNRYIEDPLEPLGVAFGILLVLIGIGTLVGMPWAHKSGSALLMVGQIVGAIAAIGIGAALAWVTRT
ncbi:hypothetical protein A4G99_11115 [Haladaptatus sp. R4]|uniref:hypothetical protein n=1 Tax=Haladaptatus sp. R4 TaxID=1679489 RepID=UPI0007B465B8|nr:hypothetical protein [Haladaptatus sp. R4]KZN24860.1 hypothetical protein A4G99_11115 [Haladaptatus sp. R4]